ncbi:MAG: hypothetical protein IT472_05755 [Thermomonas sp.]|uniref:hypothetical protein n=1 Tax=Thermomonas sp. TaxID=1971895 RepID=UPI00260D70AF|nr:hypothetical protein [Thermomonas sp.]MCC7096664.1 hypothetical protein [Thermomonas sp.]
MNGAWRLASALLACAPSLACAQSVSAQGYLDLRLAGPARQQDWTDGGLGKTRFGGDSQTAFGGAALIAWQVTPSVLASATLQLQSDQQRPLDVLEASVRWRPASTTAWRWSVKLGAFFPPVSLENDDVGWTSPWMLTPSAINSWVGEELRSTGVELRLEHRGESATWSAVASAYGMNDPAGELLAARGWALGDTSSGLFARVREPDAYAARLGVASPMAFDPFLEIDHRIGWYAGIARDGVDGSRLALLRYDNRGDPDAWTWNAGHRLYAWRTRFWSLGARWLWGDVELLSQAMTGNTAFEPVEGLYLDSKFSAGYLLLGWNPGGAWQPAVRIDWFTVHQLPDTLSNPRSEHGNALTVALNWRPNPQWRITGEVLRVDSVRSQRLLEGLSPRQVDVQLQLSLRRYF